MINAETTTIFISPLYQIAQLLRFAVRLKRLKISYDSLRNTCRIIVFGMSH